MLHSEEIEILLPEKVSEGDNVPSILAIGPSFTMIVPIILMAVFSAKIYGNNANNYMIMALITGGSSACMGIIWGISNHVVRRKKYKEKLRKTELDFQRYIADLRDTLRMYVDENTEYMFERYPSSLELIAKDAAPRFFQDEDYMFLRLGIGDCPFQVKLKKQERKEMFPDKACVAADELIEEFKYIRDVPVGADLASIGQLGFVGDKASIVTYTYILEAILKIAYSYESSKARICLFYDSRNACQKRIYEAVKFLPHMFMGGLQLRLCAGDEAGGRSVCANIKEALEDNRYIFFIFVLNESFLHGEILKNIIYEEEREDIRVFTLGSDINELSVSIRDVLVLPEEGMRYAYFFRNGNRKEYDLKILPDMVSTGPESRCIGELDMNIRKRIMSLKLENADDALPLNVGFLKLFDARAIEDIDIAQNYEKNRSKNTLRVPIGMCGRNEKIYLDVHEKYHGPHGLIAGTTGSGKSELLQTYLISLCLCYSPREVNFFLIDYKGGGTGNYISELPHCAGVISNLSGNDIQRAMEAIKAENLRRQQLFSECGVNHIDAYASMYEEGLVNQPLPHLLLIIDEFAELKKEEPDFMQQIISLAAVGRSLGIHLILATQKPQGVVDEKIWSNSKFRLCLKVQDKQDSMDMLHRKDAAFLKNPGECFMQIGNDEYLRCFKAGYCGGSYRKQEYDVEVNMILGDGMRVSSPGIKDNGEGVLLEHLANYVNQFCDANDYSKAKILWLNELPESICLDEMTTKLCQPRSPNITLGIYDDPAMVKQDRAFYCPVSDGHLAVAGSLSTGKTNVLKCIISQIANNPFMLVSLQDSDLLKAKNLPNCLGTLDCKEGISIFLYHLNRLNVRQDRACFILIDNFSLLYKHLKDEEADLLIRLIQEGIGNNIYYVLTGSMLSDFPTKIYSKIKTSLCLEMNDKYQYSDIMRSFRLNAYPKSGIPGRGIYKIDERILQIQIYDAASTFEKLCLEPANGYLCKKVPMYREGVTPAQMAEEFASEGGFKKNIIPVGYSLKTGYIRGFDLNAPGSFAISGSIGCGRHTLLENIRYMVSLHPPEIMGKVAFIEDIRNLDSDMTDYEDKFIVAIMPTGSPQEMMLNPIYRRIVDFGQGIHLGGNASSQRVLAFDDLGYAELSLKTRPGIGLLRLKSRNSTIRIKIPYKGSEGIEDDYD